MPVHELPHSDPNGVEGRIPFRIHGCKTSVDQRRVKIFNHNPPARLQRIEQPGKGTLTLWYVNEHQARMNQVKYLVWQRVHPNIMMSHLNIRMSGRR